MKSKDIKQIIFSIIFIILFGIMFLIQLNDLINVIDSNNIFQVVLTILSIIVSSVGIYVSLIYGIVKVMNSNKKTGGKKNGKKERQKES